MKQLLEPQPDDLPLLFSSDPQLDLRRVAEPGAGDGEQLLGILARRADDADIAELLLVRRVRRGEGGAPLDPCVAQSRLFPGGPAAGARILLDVGPRLAETGMMTERLHPVVGRQRLAHRV